MLSGSMCPTEWGVENPRELRCGASPRERCLFVLGGRPLFPRQTAPEKETYNDDQVECFLDLLGRARCYDDWIVEKCLKTSCLLDEHCLGVSGNEGGCPPNRVGKRAPPEPYPVQKQGSRARRGRRSSKGPRRGGGRSRGTSNIIETALHWSDDSWARSRA